MMDITLMSLGVTVYDGLFEALTQRVSGPCASLDQFAAQNHCVFVKWHDPPAGSGTVDRVAQADMFAG